MSEHVMVFGSGGDMPARFRAAAPEVATTLMCRLEHIPRLPDPTGHARVVALPYDAPDEEWVELARAVHARHAVTRVVMFGEHDQDRAAVVALALGLPTHHPAVVRQVHDKEAMRRRLLEAGVEEVPAALAASPDDVRAFGADHGWPCIVKPAGGTASFGVAVAHADADAEAAFARAAAEHDGVRMRTVLVERFLTGEQYSVEAFSEHGEHVVAAITRKYSDAESLVELGHVLPADLGAEQHTTITGHVGRVLDALGVEFGPTHTEVVLTPAGPRTIETHLRPGGDDIFAMVEDAVGVDLLGLQVRQVLGETVLPAIRQALTDPAHTRRCEAIWFAAPPVTGELIEATGVEPSSEHPDVTPKLLTPTGTQLGGLASSYSRLAQARAHAADPQTALAAARGAVERMRFLTRVPGTASAEPV
ncbi:MAG: ATP-grasp domain-containing protein [Angustibacter sp.]